MTCPACGNELKTMQVAQISVDVCDGGCGGIWFDHLELDKVDEPHECAGESLLEVLRHQDVGVDRDAPRKCPRCEGMVLFRHFYSTRHQVQVDECYRCGGFWLDVGELAAIRAQFGSQEERRQAAEAYFDQIFGQDLARMHAESDEQAAKAHRIARAFRFLCPSYYVPGKQTWGAF